jgi:hypothetical protein
MIEYDELKKRILQYVIDSFRDPSWTTTIPTISQVTGCQDLTRLESALGILWKSALVQVRVSSGSSWRTEPYHDNNFREILHNRKGFNLKPSPEAGIELDRLVKISVAPKEMNADINPKRRMHPVFNVLAMDEFELDLQKYLEQSISQI